MKNSAPLSNFLGMCDAVVAGPAMSDGKGASKVTGHLLRLCHAQLVLDAAMLMYLVSHADRLRSLAHPSVLTPHIGALAAMLACDADEIEQNRLSAVKKASSRFGAVCVLKGATSLSAAPGGDAFAYAGGGVGLPGGEDDRQSR